MKLLRALSKVALVAIVTPVTITVSKEFFIDASITCFISFQLIPGHESCALLVISQICWLERVC